MHPPLDRPHPDCGDEIEQLKTCHASGLTKFFGGCNDLKTRLDKCLKQEKARHLEILQQGVPEENQQEQDMVKKAFGKKETFAEFLAKDRDYQKALKEKKQGKQNS